jgi:hypothetical protein
MRTELNSRETDSKLASDERKALARRVNAEVEDSSRSAGSYAQGNAAHLAGAAQDQKLLLRQQDQMVDKMGQGLTTLKEMASAINTELKEQEVIVDDIDKETDKAQSKMDTAIKSIEKLLGTSNNCQLCTIAILVVIFVVGAWPLPGPAHFFCLPSLAPSFSPPPLSLLTFSHPLTLCADRAVAAVAVT